MDIFLGPRYFNHGLLLTLITSSFLAFTASASNMTCVDGECKVYLEIDANALGGRKFEVVNKICNQNQGATLIADAPSTFFSLGGHRVPDPFFQLQIPPEQCRRRHRSEVHRQEGFHHPSVPQRGTQ